MIRQKQIKFLTLPDLAALTASTITTPEFAFIVSANAFYTKVAGVNTLINPPGVSNLSLGTQTTTTVPISNSNGTGVTLPAATSLLAGAFPAADKAKVDFITITQAVDLDAAEADIADLTTLTGVASNATNLGTFTGTTIADNLAIKPTFQALETAVEARVLTSSVGVANGVASLDATGKVLSTQLPSYVDDVLEFATQAAFPAIGETGKIYVVTSGVDINKIYRWTGSVYVEVSPTVGAPVTSVFSRTGAIVATSGDYTATQITNTAAGNIAATDVQSAINELDSEKQAKLTFQEEGVNTLTAGTATTVNFVGAAVTASGSGSTVTVTIPAIATATGSTSVAAGTAGIIPAAAAGTQNQFLKGNLTYGSAIPAWTTGTAYAIGDVIYDPASNKTYRTSTAHTAGASITLGNFTELSASSTDRFDILIPTATNTIPNLSTTPLNSTRVQIAVNGIIETSGISVNASGVFTVVAGTLGYSIDTSDVITAQYLV